MVFDKAGNSATYTFTFDTVAPTGTFSYLPNDEFTNQDVTVTLKTNEPIKDLKDWTKVDNQTFTKVFKKNAKDSFTIEDLAGNTNRVRYAVKNIDKVDPVIEVFDTVGNKDSKLFSKISFKLSDNTVLDYYTLNGEKTNIRRNVSKTNINFYDIRKYLKQGENTLVVFDKAGNSATYTFTFDTVAPTGTFSYLPSDEFTNQDVTVTLKTNEPIKDLKDWTKVDNQTFTKVFKKNAEDSFTIEDLAGNTNRVRYAVRNIDKVDPKISVDRFKGNKDSKLFREVSFRLSDNTVLDYYTLNGEKTNIRRNKSNTTIDFRDIRESLKQGENTLVVFDKAGNSATYTFTFDNKIDDFKLYYGNEGDVVDGSTVIYEAISVFAKDSSKIKAYLNDDLIFSSNTKEDWYGKDWYIINNAIDLRNGLNIFKVVDEAGNEKTIKLTTKIEAPFIEVFYDNKLLKEGSIVNYDAVVVHSRDGSPIKLYLNGYEVLSQNEMEDIDYNGNRAYRIHNSIRTVEGINTFQVIDRLGLKSPEFTFTVDRVAPTGEFTYSNDGEPTNQKVIVTLEASEVIKDLIDWNTTDNIIFTKEVESNGEYEVTIEDLAGNKNTLVYEVKGIDKIAPLIKATEPKLLSGIETIDVTIIDENIAGNANKSIWVELYGSSNQSNKKGAKVDLSSGSGQFVIDTRELPDGQYILRVGSVVDAAGNKSGDKTFKFFIIDNTAPIVSIVDVAEVNPTSFKVIASDTIKLIRIDYSLWTNNNETELGVWGSSLDTKEFELVQDFYEKEGVKTLLADLPNGEYTLRATVGDSAGNIVNATSVNFLVKSDPVDPPFEENYVLKINHVYYKNDREEKAWKTGTTSENPTTEMTIRFRVESTNELAFVGALWTNSYNSQSSFTVLKKALLATPELATELEAADAKGYYYTSSPDGIEGRWLAGLVAVDVEGNVTAWSGYSMYFAIPDPVIPEPEPEPELIKYNVTYNPSGSTMLGVTATVTFPDYQLRPDPKGLWIQGDDCKVVGLLHYCKTWKKGYLENKKEVVTFEDLDGNSVDVEIDVKNIDRILNKAQIVLEDLGNNKVKVTLTADEPVKIDLLGWTKVNDEGTVWTRTYDKLLIDFLYTVTYRDLVGNTRTDSFTIPHKKLFGIFSEEPQLSVLDEETGPKTKELYVDLKHELELVSEEVTE